MQSLKFSGENNIIPPLVSYTKDKDTGYDEVKGINLVHESFSS